MAKKVKKLTIQEEYNQLSDSQKSLFQVYRTLCTALALPGNEKVCDLVAHYFSAANAAAPKGADVQLSEAKAEEAPVAVDSCGGKK